MAIGLARMFGLRLPINFNAPYRADSIRDFWRRWHITLSRFLRDYLYIPLGGNRCGPVRQIGNLLATMLLAGLWHGAGWTFVVWGGLHGVALAINHAWEKTGLRLPKPLGIALTLLFVIAGWVLFRAADFATASRMLAGMIGRDGLGRVVLDHDGMMALAAGTTIAILGPTSQEAALARLRPHPALALPAGCALVYMLLMIGGRLQHAFIYFQF
jgi:alginate O-acetyltransferase complex protein AlgI